MAVVQQVDSERIDREERAIIYMAQCANRKLLRTEKVSYQNERGDLIVHEAGLTAVELHPRREYLYNPVTDARLQALLKGGISNELYLVCLIVHLRRHFLTYGIGLKQVCDVRN